MASSRSEGSGPPALALLIVGVMLVALVPFLLQARRDSGSGGGEGLNTPSPLLTGAGVALAGGVASTENPLYPIYTTDETGRILYIWEPARRRVEEHNLDSGKITVHELEAPPVPEGSVEPAPEKDGG